VHIGTGAFLRSHQAAYLDQLMNDGQARDWAICGVGVLPSDSKNKDILREQDYLYTLTVQEADGTKENTVIGSLNRYLYAPDDPRYSFKSFYNAVKAQGYILYPGKLTTVETFRVGCMGQLGERGIGGAVEAVGKVLAQLRAAA